MVRRLLETRRRWVVSCCVLALWITSASQHGQAELVGNRLTYLEEALDPYYVGRTFPKLATPQWVGDPQVRAVVVLAIDDMREPAKYEAYLRPILDRLRAIQGRASLSIMTNDVDPRDPLLQRWLAEGVSLEIHTADHPCPLLQGGDFARARSTYERCVDRLSEVAGNQPVAFRMPCCDSMNSPSPRFYEEIFPHRTPNGHFLAMDSSVFNVMTPNDADVPRDSVLGSDGQSRFAKYVQFSSFVNTIHDYPYPYVLGRVCWEFPCVVPSDWEAQHLHQPFNPQTVSDMQAALDAVVTKQGVYNLVFHPHGWIRNDQVVELIDHAHRRYGNQVLFLSFRDALDRLNQHLLNHQPLRDAQGNDNGSRLVDIDHDGWLDVVRWDPAGRLTTRVWRPEERRWIESVQEFAMRRIHFGVVTPDGAASIVGIEPNRWRLLTWQGDHWHESPLEFDAASLSNEWRQRLLATTHDAERLRDLDGDGIDEILWTDPQASLVLSLDTMNQRWKPWPIGLPERVVAMTADGRDAGLRWVDLDDDGMAECLFSNAHYYSAHRLQRAPLRWEPLVAGDRASAEKNARVIPPFVRADGTNHGVWFHSQHLWIQNEETDRMPDKVDRLPYRDLLEVPRATNGQAPKFPPPLEPDDALQSMHSSVQANIELAAAEPLVVDPVAFDWAPDGRLFVVEMRDYPLAEDRPDAPRGRVRVLLDHDCDGRYDESHVYLDNLAYPNGIKVWQGGVFVTAAPHLIYAEDTNGDHQADRQETVLTGFGEGNQQHRVNGLVWGVDGWLYLANGDSSGQIRSERTQQTIDLAGRDLRFRPDDGQIEALSGMSQFGRTRDDSGAWFGCNNSEPLWQYVFEDRYVSRNPHYLSSVVKHLVPEQSGPAPVYPRSRTLARFNDFDRADRFTSVCGPLVTNEAGFAPPGMLDLFVCEPVHNLVHREVMQATGVTFRSQRAASDEADEILASSDNWFRPVMVRSGPDGAMWIADMYRMVIEHPEWIPAEWQAEFDVRAGQDRGRIYRMWPAGATRPQVPSWPATLTDEDLVERLEHPFRWQRDTAHQLLIGKNARAMIPQLRRVLESSTHETASLHALAILARWDALDEPAWVRCVKDPRTAVACQAIALAEPRLDASRSLQEAIIRRAVEREERLRCQIALSLGECRNPDIGTTLAEMALGAEEFPTLRAAVLTSLRPENVAAVLKTSLATDTPDQHETWLTELLPVAIELGDTPAREIIVSFLCRGERMPLTWRLATLAQSLQKLNKEDIEQFALASKQALTEQVVAARRLALDTSAEEPLRRAALQILRDYWRDGSANIDTLAVLCEPQQSPGIVADAATTLIQSYGAAGLKRLAPRWSSLSPRVRQEVLDEIVSRPELAKTLLELIESNQLSASMPASLRDRLIRSRRSDIAQLATRLLGTTPSSSRQDVYRQYLASVAPNGDVATGRQIFERNCATCHELAGVGQPVGPALASLGHRSTEQLLTAILDPNQAVEATFAEYHVELRSGQQFSGIVVEETGAGITLISPQAKRIALLRREISELQATQRSLMPEGLEREISTEQMSHLLAFLRSHQPQRKSFVGNAPETVPRRNDGSMRLLAIHAEIYGPSLVYEPAHNNLGYWSSSEDYAVWTLEVPTDGLYTVTLEYACDPATAGNAWTINCRDQQLAGIVEPTESWDNYDWKSVGTLELPRGTSQLVMRSSGAVRSYLLDLHMILLEKAK